MPKNSQNIVILTEPPSFPWDISWKGKDMFFNRFCVEEDSGFELSGVYSFKNWFGGKGARMKKGKRKKTHSKKKNFYML